MPPKPDPNDYLPLSEAAFHFLLTLTDGEKHGYAIKKEVKRSTAGKVELGPGTLYGLVKRMLLMRLIEESPGRPAAALDDERRHYYRLTRLGERVVEAEVRRLENLLAAARGRQRLARAGGH
jgi:DNA-binding PadR family transcriptional regulator